jgi:hypothetical protein
MSRDRERRERIRERDTGEENKLLSNLKEQPEQIQASHPSSVGATAVERTGRRLQIATLHRYNETIQEVSPLMADSSGGCNESPVARAAPGAYHSRAVVELSGNGGNPQTRTHLTQSHNPRSWDAVLMIPGVFAYPVF